MANPTRDELDELLENTCQAIGGNGREANAVELFRQLIEQRTAGMTASDICKWRGLDSGDPWPQREAERLSRRLIEFRKGQGQFKDWYFELLMARKNNHVYEVIVKRNIPDRNALGFWWPHFWRKRKNWIVITEPQFFRDRSDRYYIRHFGVNEPHVKLLLQKLKKLHLKPSQLVPVHHYVSIGEVRAKDAIAEGLRGLKKDIPIQFATSCEEQYETLQREHIILTGTSRASMAIQEFQRRENRLLFTHSTKGAQHRDGSQHLDSPGKAYYGIVSRIAALGTWHVKTVIACNHGPATCLIAKDLFSDDIGPRLAKALKLKGSQADGTWKGFPDAFQILFRVTLKPGDENGGEPEVVQAIRLIDVARS